MHETTINLIHGDHMDYLPKMRDNQYKLALLDPNYGIGQDGGTNRSKFVYQKNGSKLWVDDGKFEKKNWDNAPPSKKFFDEIFRVSEHQIIWGVNYFTSFYDFGPGRIFWDKMTGDSDFSDGELAYCSFHDTTKIFRYMWSGMMQGKSRFEGTVQRGNKQTDEERIHPTQKPVELYKWCLETYAEEGWTILDTGTGSANIGVACWDLKINLDGFEKERSYYVDGLERVENHKSRMLFH